MDGTANYILRKIIDVITYPCSSHKKNKFVKETPGILLAASTMIIS